MFATRFINATTQAAKMNKWGQMTPDQHAFVQDLEKDKERAAKEDKVTEVLSY